jgi:hypothetical protein
MHEACDERLLESVMPVHQESGNQTDDGRVPEYLVEIAGGDPHQGVTKKVLTFCTLQRIADHAGRQE